MFEPCPCGSGKSYLACCSRLHLGKIAAESPEQLMRARYSAFARGDVVFLLKTWSRSTRPRQLTLDLREKWLGLTIEAVDEKAATVRFAARYEADGRAGVLRETSRFRREDGAWVYVDGDLT